MPFYSPPAAIKYFKRQTNPVLNRMKKQFGLEGEFNLGVARQSFFLEVKVCQGVQKQKSQQIVDFAGFFAFELLFGGPPGFKPFLKTLVQHRF